MKRSVSHFVIACFLISSNIIFANNIGESSYEQNDTSSLRKHDNTICPVSPVYTIRYVTQNGTGSKNGSSWSNASNDLQKMINASLAGDEVWVAQGTYKPASFPIGCTGCSTSRDYSFTLKDGVAIYGGFNGSEINFDQRNEIKNKSIISGELGVTGNQDNCYHLLISVNDQAGTIFDGFNLQGGNANGSGNIIVETKKIYNYKGGAVCIESGKAKISNCKFFSNKGIRGGGISFTNYNDQIIAGCDFQYNTAELGGALYFINSSNITLSSNFSNNSAINGGSIYLDELSKVDINSCDFISNSSTNKGGALYSTGLNVTYNNSFFYLNKSKNGGAIYNDNKSISNFINCIFSKNNVSEYGGAIYNNNKSNPSIINCSFVKNIAEINGGGLANFLESSPKVKNTIFWNNSNTIFDEKAEYISSTELSYTIIEGGFIPCIFCPGTNGNIDPLFRDVSNIFGGDDNIRSRDDGLKLLPGSPAIKKGDPLIDFFEKDITDKYRDIPYDIGAYEYDPLNEDSCNIVDNCSEINQDHTLHPKTDNELYFDCILGCLDEADSELPSLQGCDFSQTPTVWYSVKTDKTAEHLFTKVISNSGLWQPVWTVYYGSCDSLKVAGYPSTPQCSNDDATPEVHQTPAYNNINKYYIAVTYSPNDPPSDGNTGFTICAATIPDITVCLGDISDNNDLDFATLIKVIEREFSDLEPESNAETGFNGPFISGEKIRVRVQFHYDALDSGVDWLMGLIPDFGNGWDLNNFDFESYLPTGTPAGLASFHAAGSECGPQAAEYFPYLCTYYDENGIFRLCNELGENCDCDKLYLDYLDPIPSGYFWLSEGSNAGCVKNSCKPHQRWGIGSMQSDVVWEFNINVKNFESQEEYLVNKDLQISFQTFSDGAIGCWEDPVTECLIDRKQFGPKWKAIYELPVIVEVLGNPSESEICSGTNINIDLMTSDGTEKTIRVFYIDNPNITGEKEYIFNNGSGTIKDTLSISDSEIDEVQVVKYYAYVEIPNSTIKTIDTFTVFVYPQPKIEKQDFVPEVCSGDLPQTLKINGSSAYTGNLLYSWIDITSGKSGSDSSIIIDNSYKTGDHKFIVTLTDQLGCSATDTMLYKINSVDTAVIKNGITLTAKEINAQFQWLNCNADYEKIVGETARSFTPIINGSYAVEIKKDGCTDTSSCHKVIITGIIENTFGDKFNVFPNPTNGKVEIETGKILPEIEISITDLNGKELSKRQYKNTSSMLLEIEGNKGVYFITIRSAGKYAIVKIVKQ